MPDVVSRDNIARGLKGVYIDTTETSFIDGEAGELYYRGYRIHDLAEQCTFEEVAYLLLFGKLPTKLELEEFDRNLKECRTLDPRILEVIRQVKDAHPMDVLRTAISAMSTFDTDVSAQGKEAEIRKGSRLISQSATIVAAHEQIRRGKEPVAPDPSLSHAANFLYMLHGERPQPAAVRAIDTDFILHADHGANASAFAARVTASTMADVYGAVTAAIATLKGPLHGGAAEAVKQMVEEIGEEARVGQYVEQALANGRRIMGLGHRMYRVEDPRARHMRRCARELGEQLGQPRWYRILERIATVATPRRIGIRARVQALGERLGLPKWYRILEKIVAAAAPLRASGIYPNVDFYAGAVYYLLRVPEDMFVCMFALGRMPGWIAQVFEQWEDNVLIRPLLRYTGPTGLEFLPLEERE